MLKKTSSIIALFCFLVIIVVAILILLGPVIGDVFFDDIPLSEIYWSTDILTWVDQNGNGVWDADEVPLGDVEITIDIIFKDRQENIQFKSYWEGKRRFLSDIYGNYRPEIFEVSVEIPKGYELTTPDHVRVDFLTRETVIPFGFTYMSGTPPVTPLTTQPVCKEKLGGQQWEIRTITSDGMVWAAASVENKVYKLNPSKNTGMIYTTDDGLVDGKYIRAIATSSEGDVWIGNSEGITRFDGSSWISYTEGRHSESVTDIAITSDGTVWSINSWGDLAHYSPDTDSWAYDGSNYGSSSHILPFSDGSLWLGTSKSIIHITPIASTDGLQIYEFSDPLTLPFSDVRGIDDMVLTDNKIWFVFSRFLWIDPAYTAPVYTAGDLGYFDLETEEWVEVQGIELFQDRLTSLALAPDNSFWIGTPDGLGHFIPSDDDPSKGSWVYYYYSIGEIGPDGKMFFAPDGTLWFGAQGNIVQCVVESE